MKCLVVKGFNAVGVQDITDAAGVPKGSFYNHFHSKEALGVEIVERYGANQTRREILTDQTIPPLQRLRRHFDRISALYVDLHFARNCILGGFSAELANQSETIRESLRKLYGLWTKDIEATIAEAQAKGEIANKTKASDLAAFLLELLRRRPAPRSGRTKPQAIRSFHEIRLWPTPGLNSFTINQKRHTTAQSAKTTPPFLSRNKMTGHIGMEENVGVTTSSVITSAQSQSASGIRQYGPLTWVALGTFATGTASFMIAALLPGLASDLSVTLTAAGQLVTVFGLTYAVSSPALSALTAGLGRRNLLLISMAAFALANFFASTATDFWQLLAARILLAAAAGLYVPNASALAGAIVAPERGTALAIVNGGTSIAVALGVPLGAMVGHALGWRMTFVGVGVMASIAVAGLFFGIPRGIDRGLSAPNIRERLAVIRQVPLWLPHHHDMGDRRLYGLHLFHALPDHCYPTRRRPCRNSFLRLGGVGRYRLILGRHAER